MLGIAISLASDKAKNIKDKGGKAYILHPIRVMFRLNSGDSELNQIAVLHDTVEDSDVSLDNLRDIGFSERVVCGVDAMSRRDNEDYNNFIERLSENYDAVLIKLEDLRDNMDLGRLKGVTKRDFQRMEKYSIAFTFLKEKVKNSDKKGVNGFSLF